MSGKEARYILKQNSVNLAWLAEQIGISPQALNSRLNADIFSRQNMIEINQISIPILDLRLSAGFGNGLFDDDLKPMEYVSIPGLSGCVGLTIQGDSMLPRYRSGDIVFVRPIQDVSIIDWGHPYVIIAREDRFIKLLYPSDDAECIRLVSANEETRADGSRLYPDNNIPKADILYIYKVVGTLRREQI